MKSLNTFLYSVMVNMLLCGAVLSKNPQICYEAEPFNELVFPQINGSYWYVETQTQPGCEGNYCLTTFSNSNRAFSLGGDGAMKGASKLLNVLQVKLDVGLLDCIDPEAAHEIMSDNPGVGNFFKAISKIEGAKMFRLFINARNTLIEEWFCDFYLGIVESFLDVSLKWYQPKIESFEKAFNILFKNSLNARDENLKPHDQHPLIKPGLLERLVGPILNATSVSKDQRGQVIKDAFEINKGLIERIIHEFGPIYLHVVSEEENIFSMAWPLKPMADLADDFYYCMYRTARILQSAEMVHVVWMTTVISQSHNCLLDPKLDPEEKRTQRKLLRGFELRRVGSSIRYASQQTQSGSVDECAVADFPQEPGTEWRLSGQNMGEQGVVSDEFSLSRLADAHEAPEDGRSFKDEMARCEEGDAV
jgi:hypothetical protein